MGIVERGYGLSMYWFGLMVLIVFMSFDDFFLVSGFSRVLMVSSLAWVLMVSWGFSEISRVSWSFLGFLWDFLGFLWVFLGFLGFLGVF